MVEGMLSGPVEQFDRMLCNSPMTSLSKRGLGTACFSKAPGTFQARKAIFSSSVSKNGREMYAPKTSCMKGTTVHIKNM